MLSTVTSSCSKVAIELVEVSAKQCFVGHIARGDRVVVISFVLQLVPEVIDGLPQAVEHFNLIIMNYDIRI